MLAWSCLGRCAQKCWPVVLHMQVVLLPLLHATLLLPAVDASPAAVGR